MLSVDIFPIVIDSVCGIVTCFEGAVGFGMYRIGVCDVKTKEILEDGFRRYEKRQNLLLEVDWWDTIDDMMDTLFKGKDLDILFLGAQPEGTLDMGAGEIIHNELGEQGLYIVYVSDKEDFSRDVIQKS